MTEEEFRDELLGYSTPVYPTYQDLKEQYQAQYGERWKPHLADDVYSLVEQEKELKDPRNSTLRAIQRHEKGTYSDYAAKYTDAFQELAESLGPLRYDPPSGGFRLDFDVEVFISEGPCEERLFSVYLSALDAFSILNTDDEVDFLDLVHLYFPEGLVDHLCSEPSVTITPLEGRGQTAVAAGSNDDFYEENPFDA